MTPERRVHRYADKLDRWIDSHPYLTVLIIFLILGVCGAIEIK